MATKVLDQRAQAAVDFLRSHPKEWAGAIVPRWLPSALPPRSSKRGWRDAVSLLLLSEIISVHRVSNGGEAFFRGPLYQIGYAALARQFNTDVDEIGESANWLRQIGVVGLVHRTRIDHDGQPRGSMVFAFPIMGKLEEFRQAYLATGKTPAPIKYESRVSSKKGTELDSRTVSSATHVIGGSPSPKRQFAHADETAPILTAPKQQLKLAGSGGETSTQRHNACDDRGSRVVAGGGGMAADDKGKQVAAPTNYNNSAKRPSANSAHLNGQRPSGPSAELAPPHWRPARRPADLTIETPEQQTAWRSASRLCTLYSQVMMRYDETSCCDLPRSDHLRAFKFFSDFTQSRSFYLTGLCIRALLLRNDSDFDANGGYDGIWHCRWVLNFAKFLAYVKAGKIESEIGHAGVKINTWYELRMFFTESELIFYGWRSDKIPIMPIEQSDLWETDPAATLFYRNRNLPLPVEIQTNTSK
jgi:hypothetical protein